MNGGVVGSANLGELIASYRRRKQDDRRVAWSQENLAFACDTGQAHISRIERNQQHPEYMTLVRICEALELSYRERAHIMALAGYEVAAPLPGHDVIATVLTALVPLMEAYPYPVMLLDEGERQWYFNRMAITVFGDCYGVTDSDTFHAGVRGRRAAETIFDPAPGAAALDRWKAYYDEADEVVTTRVVGLLWRAHGMRPRDSEMDQVIKHLRSNSEFEIRWDRFEHDATRVMLVDHHTYSYRHPRLGRLRMHSWRTRPSIDERFVMVHFTPVDSLTSFVFSDLVDRLIIRPTSV